MSISDVDQSFASGFQFSNLNTSDLVLAAGGYFEAESVEIEAAADNRYIFSFKNYQPRNRGCLLVRQLPIKHPVQVAYGDRSLCYDRAVVVGTNAG